MFRAIYPKVFENHDVVNMVELIKTRLVPHYFCGTALFRPYAPVKKKKVIGALQVLL
jgi:hypothetical protein